MYELALRAAVRSERVVTANVSAQVAREASQRVLGLRPFDVQLIGAMILHKGEIAEMRTGEGKTLSPCCPLTSMPCRARACMCAPPPIPGAPHCLPMRQLGPITPPHAACCACWQIPGASMVRYASQRAEHPLDSVQDWKGAGRHCSPGQQQLVLQGADLLTCRGRW